MWVPAGQTLGSSLLLSFSAAHEWHVREYEMVDTASTLVSDGIWAWIQFLPLYSCTSWTWRWTTRSPLKERLIVQLFGVLVTAGFPSLVPSRLPQLHRAASPRSWLSKGGPHPWLIEVGGPMQDDSDWAVQRHSFGESVWSSGLHPSPTSPSAKSWVLPSAWALIRRALPTKHPALFHMCFLENQTAASHKLGLSL